MCREKIAAVVIVFTISFLFCLYVLPASGEESSDPPERYSRDDKVVVARGVVKGTVCAIGDKWIEVKSISGKKVRYLEHWEKGRKVTEGLKGIKIGDFVGLKWLVNDHPRVIRVEKIEKAEKEELRENEKGKDGEREEKVEEKKEPAIDFSEDEKNRSQDPPEKRTPGKDGKKNSFATGSVIGIVKAKGEAWVELTSASGKTEKYIPEWYGGAAKDGGGPNSTVVAQITAIKIGDKIEIVWYVNDHLRIEKIKRIAAAEKREDKAEGAEKNSIPEKAHGFFGMVDGTILEKDGDDALSVKVNSIKNVWKKNKAEEPKALVGKTIRVIIKSGDKRVERIMALFALFRKYERVSLEIRHVRGDLFEIGELTKEQRERIEKTRRGKDK